MRTLIAWRLMGLKMISRYNIEETTVVPLALSSIPRSVKVMVRGGQGLYVNGLQMYSESHGVPSAARARSGSEANGVLRMWKII